jgi:hypothetical protein
VDRESRKKHRSRDRSESPEKSKHRKYNSSKDHRSPSRKDKEDSKKRRRSPSPRVTSTNLESIVSRSNSTSDTSSNIDLKEKVRLALGGAAAIVITKEPELQVLSMKDRIKLALAK